MQTRNLMRWAALGIAAGAAVAAAADMTDGRTAPDAAPPAKERPVQVYLLSGQSNMVGMGEIGPQGMTRFDTFVSAEPKAEPGCVVSTYRGAYDPAVDYDRAEPVSVGRARVGYWPHASFPEAALPCVQVARGFIRIARKGLYSFASGNLLAVNGRQIYSREPGREAVSERIELEPGVYPIRIVHFGRGQTNLSYHQWDVPGTLLTLVKQQGRFPHLLDRDGNWRARDDVFYKGVISAVGRGPLAPGVQSGGTIGPELGFGWIVGDYHDEPVLLIKASIGNRSLGWDILPPGSERFEF